MNLFDRWGSRQAGLFTFPESPRHVGLYQKFGFWPQGLTPLLEKTLNPAGETTYSTFSEVRESGRDTALAGCRDLAESIFAGLDLGSEILATDAHGLGETVFLDGQDGIDGFAVCHCGGGTEAGSGACYIKFGAARPGDGASKRFERLLDACESLAADRGLDRLVAGCNTARHGAYRTLLGRGFRAFLNGLAMLRPNEPGYNRPEAWVIDDLR